METDCKAKDVMNRREAAEYLGICLSTLDRLEDITRSRMRHRVAFKRDELNKWLDQHSERKRRKK